MSLSSTCVKCGGTSFETKEVEPRNSRYKLIFVQCSSCGGVVGVTEFFNIGSMLQTLAKKMGLGSLG